MKLSNKAPPEIVTFPSQLGLERHSMDQHVYNEYLAILREEIVPALGCTEPIAIAYASAKARRVLGRLPEHITVKCSGNIIKNVKA